MKVPHRVWLQNQTWWSAPFAQTSFSRNPMAGLILCTWSWVHVFELYRHSLNTPKWSVLHFMEDWEKFSFQWFKKTTINELNPWHCQMKLNETEEFKVFCTFHSSLKLSQSQLTLFANTMDSWLLDLFLYFIVWISILKIKIIWIHITIYILI